MEGTPTQRPSPYATERDAVGQNVDWKSELNYDTAWGRLVLGKFSPSPSPSPPPSKIGTHKQQRNNDPPARQGLLFKPANTTGDIARVSLSSLALQQAKGRGGHHKHRTQTRAHRHGHGHAPTHEHTRAHRHGHGHKHAPTHEHTQTQTHTPQHTPQHNDTAAPHTTAPPRTTTPHAKPKTWRTRKPKLRAGLKPRNAEGGRRSSALRQRRGAGRSRPSTGSRGSGRSS